MKYRAGISQKLSLASASAKQVRSNFRRWVVGMCAKGRLNAGEVGAGASSAVQSGADAPDICRVARAKPSDRLVKRRKAREPIPSTGNSARSLHRTLVKDSKLDPCYTAKVRTWHLKRDCQVQRNVAFLPIQEAILYTVDPADAYEYSSFSADRAEFDVELTRAANRLNLERAPTGAAISIWGDGAKYGTRDTLNLLSMQYLSGVHRTRHWIVAFSKRAQCQCGCKGKCTFSAFSCRRVDASCMHRRSDACHSP